MMDEESLVARKSWVVFLAYGARFLADDRLQQVNLSHPVRSLRSRAAKEESKENEWSVEQRVRT